MSGSSIVAVVSVDQSTVHFDWSTNYANKTGDQYFNPQIQVSCQQGGPTVWSAWSDTALLLAAGSPTPEVALGGSGNPGLGGWFYQDAGFDPTQAAFYTVTLFHYGAKKPTTLATTNFTVYPR